MPECPSCFREFDYDGMMAHDAGACRRLVRAVMTAARERAQFVESHTKSGGMRHTTDVRLMRAISDLDGALTPGG